MGYPIGEVTMVDYSILNTKSLPFSAKEDFYRELQNFVWCIIEFQEVAI